MAGRLWFFKNLSPLNSSCYESSFLGSTEVRFRNQVKTKGYYHLRIFFNILKTMVYNFKIQIPSWKHLIGHSPCFSWRLLPNRTMFKFRCCLTLFKRKKLTNLYYRKIKTTSQIYFQHLWPRHSKTLAT